MQFFGNNLNTILHMSELHNIALELCNWKKKCFPQLILKNILTELYHFILKQNKKYLISFHALQLRK